jgi:adenine-specific DNA-methyltransferase
VDWDSTKNLFIEGDNLEVLKLLQKSYHKKVKMIYIDPPYNTGNEFIYPDKFQDNLDTYLRYTGQVDDEGFKVSTNSEIGGRYHTNWLNMMYPRLKLARNLLRDDGVIFISIDDNEQVNLKKVCDEIFGEENFIGNITRVAKTTSFRGNFIAPGKDYLLVYAKQIEFTQRFQDSVDSDQYKKVEREGSRLGEKYRDDIAFYLSTLETRPNQRYYIECPDGSKVLPPGSTFPPDKPIDGDGVWRWNKETFNKNKELIVFKKTNRSPLIDEKGKKANWNIYTKSYLKDKLEKGNIPRDFWMNFLNRHGTAELKKLDVPYSFPKPTVLIIKLLSILQLKDDDVVLDFFAGSNTTAHSIIKYNSVNNLHVRYLMIQLPELIEESNDAYKAGYKTIADIGKERIRRAGKKIREENPDYTGDLGFKVFKLDSSNIKPWDADFDNYKEALMNSVENIKTERTEQDVLFELLLKYGLNLTIPIETRSIQGKNVYIIGAGALVVCLDDEITLDAVEGIAKLKEELKPEIMRVVFKDAGFKDATVKTNTVQILKIAGIEDVKSL